MKSKYVEYRPKKSKILMKEVERFKEALENFIFFFRKNNLNLNKSINSTNSEQLQVILMVFRFNRCLWTFEKR